MENENENQEIAIPGTGLVIMYGSTEIGRAPGPDMPGPDEGPEDEPDEIPGPAPGPAGTLLEEKKELGIIRAGDLRFLVDSLLAINSEVKLNIGQSGIWVRCVDNANVAMITLDLKPGQVFVPFQGEGTDTLGIDLTWLKKVIPKNKKEMVHIHYDKKYLYLSGDSITTSTLLLDVNTIRKEPNPIGLEFPEVPARVDAGALVNHLKAIKAINKDAKICLRITPGILEVSTYKGDTGEYKGTVPYEGTLKGRSLYSLVYLLDMVRALKGTDTLEIYLKDDYPVKMGANILNCTGRIEYLLAPRIESND